MPIAARLGGFFALLLIALEPRATAGEIAALQQQLAARQAELGPNAPALLPLLEGIAAADFRDGKWEEATEARRKTVRIALQTAPDRAGDAITAQGLLYVEQQRYLDAEPLLLAIARGVQPTKKSRALAFAGLARIAAAKGDADAAVTWAQQGAALAPDKPDILRALGTAMGAAHRVDESERALKQAAALDRARHGSDSLEAARSVSLLGNLYLHEDRPREALPLLQEATAIDQARLPPGHPFIGDDLHDLGLAYEALKRRDEALLAMRAALRELAQGAARGTPRAAYVESDLSRLYRDGGDEAAAEDAMRNARRILNKAEAEERRRERQV